ncbi:hypothetical protein G6F65_019067 [Rhizopus arrhizus]|nr:hypothetical protein G6F65_019067 [Rhizopus arrhizus]
MPCLTAEHVDAARGQAGAQDVVHLLELELGRRGLVDDIAIAFELRVHALEVEAGGKFAVRLVDGVGEFVFVDFGDDVKSEYMRIAYFTGPTAHVPITPSTPVAAPPAAGAQSPARRSRKPDTGWPA